MIFFARWTPAIYWSLVSKPVSQDIQSICYCLHTGIFRLDTCDLVVAGVPISISSKYLYLYLALKVLTFFHIRSVPTRSLFSRAFLHVPAAGYEITKPFVRNTRSRPIPALGTAKRAERRSQSLNFVRDFYFRINQ